MPSNRGAYDESISVFPRLTDDDSAIPQHPRDSDHIKEALRQRSGPRQQRARIELVTAMKFSSRKTVDTAEALLYYHDSTVIYWSLF